MQILVINCGSSSVKFQLVETSLEMMKVDQDRLLAKGVIERIGSQAIITLQGQTEVQIRRAAPIRDHKQALDYVLKWLVSPESGVSTMRSLADIDGVGHRIVHGGEAFKASTRITPDVIKGIEDCIELAPLHNPANLSGIKGISEVLGSGIPQVAVFDTAFHAKMPEESYLYAVPYQFYRRYKLRRYGFHGTSHRYVSYRYRQIKGLEKEQVKIITIHLGNGCSACAIDGGWSVDTSMGLTPLEGLVMGTRSGDIDPAVIDFLAHKEGLSISEIDNILNKQSGLLGISGLTHDMRELIAEESENQDRRARLAIAIFCKRVRKYIGSYLAELNGADALVFTGGIGENSAFIRERICTGLEWFGVELDEERNRQTIGGKGGLITRDGARLPVYAIPTNEELLIARDSVRCILGRSE